MASTAPIFNSQAIYGFLGGMHCNSGCVFALNGDILAIGSQIRNPIVYDRTTEKARVVGQTEGGSGDPITAISLSPSNDFVATGQKDGSVTLYSLKESSNAPRYRLIHEAPIADIAFLGENMKIVMADEKGIITLLTLVQSLSCELVLQTTIINLNSKINSFVALGSDLIAFGSGAGFSVLRVGRRIEALLNRMPPIATPVNLALICQNGINRILFCYASDLTLADIGIGDKKEPKLLESVSPKTIVRCLFASFEKFILIFDDQTAAVFNEHFDQLLAITGVPPNIKPRNFFYRDGFLICFGDNEVTELKASV